MSPLREDVKELLPLVVHPTHLERFDLSLISDEDLPLCYDWLFEYYSLLEEMTKLQKVIPDSHWVGTAPWWLDERYNSNGQLVRVMMRWRSQGRVLCKAIPLNDYEYWKYQCMAAKYRIREATKKMHDLSSSFYRKFVSPQIHCISTVVPPEMTQPGEWVVFDSRHRLPPIRRVKRIGSYKHQPSDYGSRRGYSPKEFRLTVCRVVENNKGTGIRRSFDPNDRFTIRGLNCQQSERNQRALNLVDILSRILNNQVLESNSSDLDSSKRITGVLDEVKASAPLYFRRVQKFLEPHLASA